MKPTTILLADDHPIVRHGLRVVLDAEADLHVVGEAADGLEAVALVERLKPAVLIVDLLLPGLGGLEVTAQTCRRSPRTRIMVLSMYDDQPHVLEALQCGAVGYVLKGASAAEVVDAVRATAAGHRYLSPLLSERAADAYAEQPKAVLPDRYSCLTPRERQVLHLVAEGRTSSQIAERLVISRRTVEMYRAHLLRKLGARSQADIIRFAIQLGLLPAPPPLT
ncbi:MAG: response regulator transcription factor [Chloroflexi bacterium]|nr:response regulator transcription factor [Chloroflexota bacterium]